METQQVKDMRKAKFLAKLNKDKSNKNNKIFDTSKSNQSLNNSNISNINNLQYNSSSNLFSNNFLSSQGKNNESTVTPTPLPNVSDMNSQGFFNFNPNDKNSNNINKDNNINPNDIFKNLLKNNAPEKKIDLNIMIEKVNQVNYIINILYIVKKILVIILSLMHCLKFSVLRDHKTLKYTYLLLEITYFVLNQYYEKQTKLITGGENFDNPEVNQEKIQLLKLFDFFNTNFKAVGYVFDAVKIIRDIMLDISILLIINIIYFIFTEEDD